MRALSSLAISALYLAFVVALTCLAAVGAVAGEDRRQQNVLIVFSNDAELPAVQLIAKGLRSGFAGSSHITLYTEYFDEVRFPAHWTSGRFARYLREKYEGLGIDLMVGVGDDAISLLRADRATLSLEAPIIFNNVPPGDPSISGLTNGTGIYSHMDILKLVELARQMLPNAEHIVVVSGATGFDRKWDATARNTFKALEKSYRISYLSALPLSELLARLKELRPDTIVVYLSMFEDGAGEQFVPREIARRLAEASQAPLFGVYDSYIGFGVAGVYADRFEGVGHETARLALRVLAGERASDIAPYVGDTHRLIVDGSVLERLGLAFANLPEGTVIENWTPPAWWQYRWHIVAAAAIIIAQTLLIAFVLLQNRKRRRAEHLLKANEERMTHTAATANVGLWRYNREMDELWATEHAREMLGLASDAPVTRDAFLAAVHPEDREAAIASLRESWTDDQPPVDVRVVLANGQIRWISIRARVDPANSAAPRLMSGVFVDITEQKAADAEVALQRQEIAHLMRVSVLGELSGAIAHEITQPLTAVQSNAETGLDLAMGNAPDLAEIRDVFGDIVQDSRRASEVVERLRRLLKKGEKKFEPIDVNELVTATVALLNSELIGRGINVRRELAKALPATTGDPIQLQQVLLNLVMNAMDAMAATPASNRFITIAARATQEGAVQILVQDRGAGIPPADGKRVFDAFFTTKPRGLGLGLTICSTIIEAHGGVLSLSNGDDGGAVAKLTLPAVQALAAAQ